MGSWNSKDWLKAGLAGAAIGGGLSGNSGFFNNLGTNAATAGNWLSTGVGFGDTGAAGGSGGTFWDDIGTSGKVFGNTFTDTNLSPSGLSDQYGSSSTVTKNPAWSGKDGGIFNMSNSLQIGTPCMLLPVII